MSDDNDWWRTPERPQPRGVVHTHEHKPASKEKADDACRRRDAERRSIVTRHELVRAGVLLTLPPKGAPTHEEMRSCKGNRLKLVRQWAEAAYRDIPLPGRGEMLRDFRRVYGHVANVTEKGDMQLLRSELATADQKRGGKPTHRKGQPGHLPSINR